MSLIAWPQDFFSNESQDREYLEYLVDVTGKDTITNLPRVTANFYFQEYRDITLITLKLGKSRT